MPDVPTLPEIVPSGERMIYLVRSDTNPARQHRVDLLDLSGYGSCSCKDWATRRGPAVKAGAAPGSRAVLCKHLIAARRFFLNQLLRTMALAESAPPT
jgi:hypothetical protein